MPVQARSAVTLEALHVAAIQVLAKDGLKLCTTTRIAERAGMSVGSLYQYYPNRDALLMAVIERELDRIVAAVEQTYRECRGKPVAHIASAFVSGYLAAKLRNAEQSKALYAVAQDGGGAERIVHARSRIVATLAAMLASASDAHFHNPAMTATVALSALLGPVQSLLEGHTPAGFEQQLERELILLLKAYFAMERDNPGHSVEHVSLPDGSNAVAPAHGLQQPEIPLAHMTS